VSELIPAVARAALLAGAGSLFLALCSQVAVYLPFSPVPVTGQTFGVLVLGALLGSRLGPAAVTLYLAEGALGLPVFSPGPTWGLARLISPTGGYLLGFVAAAWVVGRLGEAGWRRQLGPTVASLLLGTAAIYVGGLVGLTLYLPLDRALALGVLPFVLGDALKIGLAAVVAYRQRPLAGQ
jgi:biotin transport system substrate-specific component